MRGANPSTGFTYFKFIKDAGRINFGVGFLIVLSVWGIIGS